MDQLLEAFLSPDDGPRAAAEASLQQHAAQPGFAHQLMSTLLDTRTPPHLRQTAGVLLSKFVNDVWTTGAVGADERAAVHELALQGLSLPERQLRTASSVVVCRVAAHDFPDAWPDLTDRLVGLLQSGPDGLLGGLACVRVLLEDLSMESILPLVDALFPVLLAALQAPEVPDRVKARVVVVLKEAMSNLPVLRPQDTVRILQTAVPAMLQPFASFLVAFDPASSDPSLTKAILGTVTLLVQLFPKVMLRVAGQLMPVMWNVVPPLLQVYEAQVINGGADALGDAYDSDNENMGVDAIIMQVISFFSTVQQAPVPQLVTAIEPLMPNLLGAMASFARITDAQVALWAEDAAKYVADEEEDSMECTVRNLAVSFAMEACEIFDAAAMQALMELAQQQLPMASQDWKVGEVALWFAGIANDAVVRAGPEMINSLAQTILTFAGEDAPPLLRARALWSAATLCSHKRAPVELLEPFLPLVVRCIGAHNPLPVRISATRAMGHIAMKLDEAALMPVVPAVLQGIIELVPHAEDQATLLVFIDTISEVCLNCPQGAAPVRGPVCECAFGLWAAHRNDPMVGLCVTDIVRAVASVPGAADMLLEGALPAIAAALVEEDDGCATAIDLVEAIVGTQPVDAGLPPALLSEALMGPLLQLGLQSDFHSIMQNACDAMAAYVRVASQQLVGTAYVPAILQLLQRVLAPDMSEDAGLNAAALAVEVITRLGGALGADVVQQLASLLMARMASARLPNLLHALVLAWARLINADPASTLGLLDDGAFAVLMQRWSEFQLDVTSHYYQRVTTAALAKLLVMPDGRLDSTTVDGDPIPSQGRASRSKGPVRYQQVPVRQRAFALLVRMGVKIRGEAAEDDADDGYDSYDEFGFDEDDVDVGGGDGNSPFMDADCIETDEDGNYMLSDSFGMSGMEADDLRRNPAIVQDPLNDLDVDQFLAQFFQQLDPALVAQGANAVGLDVDERALLGEWVPSSM